jgi:hypothetical protein
LYQKNLKIRYFFRFLKFWIDLDMFFFCLFKMKYIFSVQTLSQYIFFIIIHSPSLALLRGWLNKEEEDGAFNWEPVIQRIVR